MQNWLLQAYCIKLYDETAKFLSSEKKNCRVACIENCIDYRQIQAVRFSLAGKKYSLPILTFNKEFQILSDEQKGKNFSVNSESIDVILSLFNLHSLSQNDQIDFIRKMQTIAPRAIFLEYENPERNLAYAGYFSFILWQYCLCIVEDLFLSPKNSFSCFHAYLQNGAVEGVLYALPQILPAHSIKMLSRKHFGFGAIGMAYLEW
jgi:hypothetical protein